MKPQATITQDTLENGTESTAVLDLPSRPDFSSVPLETPPSGNGTPLMRSKVVASNRTHRILLVGIASIAILLLVGGGFWAIDSLRMAGKQTGSFAASGGVASNYTRINQPASTSSLRVSTQRGTPALLTVNGQTTITDGLILSPGSVPTTPQAGEFYYDGSTKQPYYYNGTAFVSLSQPARGGVVSVGGLSGTIALGTGLQVVNNQLAAVPQVSVGITALFGTAGQVEVSANTGSITLSLPQSITPTATPTFAGLTLSSPLSLANGGTGATTPSGVRSSIGAASDGANSDITSTAALDTITPNSMLTIGDASQQFILQGNGSSQVSAKSGGFTTTLTFASPTANVDLRFPALTAGSYDVCTTSGNCGGGGGSGIGGSGTTNTFPIFTGTNSLGNSILTQSGSTVTASGTVAATSLTGDGSGVTNVNAVSLQGNGAAFFTNASNLSSGTLADVRLSTNVALLNGSNNFTGATLQHNGNNICDSSNNCNYLTGSAANGAYIQLQGSTPGTVQTGNFNISGTGIAGSVRATTVFQNGNQVCDTSGNCVGGGGSGSAVGGFGTTNTIAMFTATGTIGDSTLTQSGTTITASGTLAATNLQGNGAAVTNVNAVTLQGNNASFFTNASNISSGTLADARLSSNVALLSGNNNFTGVTLQHNGNTVCDNSNNCGFLTGAGGGSGGVASLNGLSGTLILANASGSGSTVTINDASTSQKGIAKFNAADFTASVGSIDTIQGIAITSSPTFAGLTLSAPLAITSGGTGAATAASARSNLGAAASGVNGDITATTALNTITPSGGTLTVSGFALLKSSSNSTAAFQVQNSSSANLFTVDTTNNVIVLGNDGAPAALTVRGGVASGNNVAGSTLTLAASNGTGAGGSGDLIFQTAPPAANSVITQDGSADFGNTGFGSSSTFSWSHTTGASGPTSGLLLVGVSIEDNTKTVSTVTYNGVNLTRLGNLTITCPTTIANPSCEDELWYLKAPPSGLHTIQVNLSGSTSASAGAVGYSNVDQTTPFGTPASNSGSVNAGGGASSLSVATSSASQLVVETFSFDLGGGAGTAGSGQTQLWQDTIDRSAASSAAGTGAPVTMQWTGLNSSDWADIGVAINPVVNTTPDIFSDRLHITADGNIGIDNNNPQSTLDIAGTARVQTSTNATTAFQIQDASGAVLLTADTVNMRVTVSTLIVSTTLTVNGHIVSSGSAPTIAAGTAACTGPTVTVTGTDTAGFVTVTTGTGCGTSGPGQLATVTFHSAYTTAPQVELTSATSAAAALPVYDTTSATTFVINTPNTPTDATAYTYRYFTVQ